MRALGRSAEYASVMTKTFQIPADLLSCPEHSSAPVNGTACAMTDREALSKPTSTGKESHPG